jgi:hypothetical protein
MTTPQPVYWPFPVIPVEQQTSHHRLEVDFLEAAYRDGYRPCKFADGEYRLESGTRTAWLIFRGRLRGGQGSRWEVWLNDGGDRVTNTWADGFEPAAAKAFEWVREGHSNRTDANVHVASAAINH